MVCIVYNIIKLRNCHNMCVVGGFCGYGGSVWVMGEWGVGQWIVDITSFQKIYCMVQTSSKRSYSGKVGVMTDKQTESISTYRLGPSVGWAE